MTDAFTEAINLRTIKEMAEKLGLKPGNEWRNWETPTGKEYDMIDFLLSNLCSMKPKPTSRRYHATDKNYNIYRRCLNFLLERAREKTDVESFFETLEKDYNLIQTSQQPVKLVVHSNFKTSVPKKTPPPQKFTI